MEIELPQPQEQHQESGGDGLAGRIATGPAEQPEGGSQQADRRQHLHRAILDHHQQGQIRRQGNHDDEQDHQQQGDHPQPDDAGYPRFFRRSLGSGGKMLHLFFS